MSRSIIEYIAENERFKCGYCKSPDTNYGHGMWAHSITVTDYQDLIDRGWRRSGKYCYKPTLDIICCPMYTIRCRGLEFKATKSQKKVLKRFNKFLEGKFNDESVRNSGRHSSCSDDMNIEEFGEGCEQYIEMKRDHQDIDVTLAKVPTEGLNYQNNEQGATSSSNQGPQQEITAGPTKGQIRKDTGPDPNKSPCKKAKQMRRERKLQKLKERGIDISSLNRGNKNKEKQIEDLLNEMPENVKHKFEIKLVRTNPPSDEWKATAKESHEVYVKYQTKIHGDKPEKCTEPKFHEFLVHSPLLEQHSEDGPPCGYGSFHQQYWLDGKIIAVGVIDILPKCVSSVYFFYDPQYRSLTLGIYGALSEISFTRSLHTLSPKLKYYYMGFYIHSCQKMRYKGNFFPSDLLCPETYKWFPLSDCIPKLEIAPYTRLDPDIDSVDENFPSDNDINCIPIWVKDEFMLYKAYRRKYGNRRGDNIEDIQNYARLVGAKTAKSLIMVR